MNISNFSRLFRDLAEQEQRGGVSDEQIARFIEDSSSASERHEIEMALVKDATLRERITRATEMFSRLTRRESNPAESQETSVVEQFFTSCSEALKEVIEAFSWNVTVLPDYAKTLHSHEAKDRTAEYVIEECSDGGVRFVVTSHNPKDEGTRLEFVLEPSGEWKSVATLERIAPAIDEWQAWVELSHYQRESFAKQGRNQIRIRRL